MITLWGRRNSSNVQKATWALAEIGLPYERRNVGGTFGLNDDPEYRAMNPTGLVPTLRDDELTLWESDAILRYLARRYGEGILRPADEAGTALADQWATWNTTTFYPAVAALFFPTVRTKRAEQDFSTLGPQAARMAEAAALLDRALGDRPWVAGDRFTFGDMGLAISANRAFQLPFGAPDPAAAPNLARWLEAVRARPPFREHVDLPIGTCLEEWIENERARP